MTAFLRHKVVWIHAYQIWWLLIVSYFSLFCQWKIKIQKHHMIKHTTKSINESRNLYHFQHTTFSIIKTWQNANNCLCFAPSSTPKKEKKKLKHWACCVDQHQHWVSLQGGVAEDKDFLAKRWNIPRLLTVIPACVREQHLLSPSGELTNCFSSVRSSLLINSKAGHTMFSHLEWFLWSKRDKWDQSPDSWQA